MGSSSSIRVLIVDDHSMVRRGLATILRVKPGFELVGEASNGQEAISICEQVHPDVVLMDLVMPMMDGTAATRAIRERCPDVQVLVLTSFKEKDLVEGALAAGAIGYLLKNVSAEELASAIQAAHAGRPTMAPEVKEWLAQVDRLERLGRAILEGPPDASALTRILSDHVPHLLPDTQSEIRLFPDQVLFRQPDDWPPVAPAVWHWLASAHEARYFLPGAALPWSEALPTDHGLLLAPITAVEDGRSIGGIYGLYRGDATSVPDRLPVVQSLAAQISSALHSAWLHAQALAQQSVARELAMAGRIQASFLPSRLPAVDGWQLAASLVPARETAGDFYDLISLPGGRLGIVIADVADKGMGAALFMALCRTLIRTFASEYQDRPDLVLAAANHRMLADTRAELFVTMFYGVLDPATGQLVYANAGHNPPYCFDGQDPAQPRALRRTGMALGVLDNQAWQVNQLQVSPGQALLLYTDGVVEAQDENREQYGAERLITFIGNQFRAASRPPSAGQVQKALLTELQAFVGNAPQYDDITLVIAIRDG